jgi:hypothetical protein
MLRQETPSIPSNGNAQEVSIDLSFDEAVLITQCAALAEKQFNQIFQTSEEKAGKGLMLPISEPSSDPAATAFLLFMQTGGAPTPVSLSGPQSAALWLWA